MTVELGEQTAQLIEQTRVRPGVGSLVSVAHTNGRPHSSSWKTFRIVTVEPHDREYDHDIGGDPFPKFDPRIHIPITPLDITSALGKALCNSRVGDTITFGNTTLEVTLVVNLEP
jgi:hypothetical protein